MYKNTIFIQDKIVVMHGDGVLMYKGENLE